MPRKPNPKPTDAEQSKRFLEAAKALEVDKTGEAFKWAMVAVLPAEPKPSRKVRGA